MPALMNGDGRGEFLDILEVFEEGEQLVRRAVAAGRARFLVVWCGPGQCLPPGNPPTRPQDQMIGKC